MDQEKIEFWDNFMDAINTDKEDIVKKSKGILNLYDIASIEEKEKIDDLFIMICGYSVDTLREGR